MQPNGSTMGRFYGVGVGPGDPELLTVKAQRVLQAVPVVCIPKRSAQDDSYAYSIVKHVVDPARQEVLGLLFPMVKDPERLAASWDAAVEAILGRLEQGKDAAFITEGDPFFYSTFVYIYQLLRQRRPGISVEVVPGVSSVNAAAAAAGLPLADGDDRLAVLPATYDDGRLQEALRQFDAVVLIKLSSVFDRVLDTLEELGLADQAVCVTRCSRPDERVVRDIRGLRGTKLDYFSILIVRKQ